jgi:hypothetical protein
MSCANPIDAAILADYWLGILDAANQESVEEHLFLCDDCGLRLQEVIALADGIRDIARHGNLLSIVDDAFLKRAAGEGLRIREYAPPRGGSVQCTVSADDDLLIGRLNADLSHAKRLDLSLCGPDGNERARLSDVPFRPDEGSVAFQQPIDYAKAAPSDMLVVRLLEIDDSGSQQVLGDYTFIHTRTIPGPPGW